MANTMLNDDVVVRAEGSSFHVLGKTLDHRYCHDVYNLSGGKIGELVSEHASQEATPAGFLLGLGFVRPSFYRRCRETDAFLDLDRKFREKNVGEIEASIGVHSEALENVAGHLGVELEIVHQASLDTTITVSSRPYYEENVWINQTPYVRLKAAALALGATNVVNVQRDQGMVSGTPVRFASSHVSQKNAA